MCIHKFMNCGDKSVTRGPHAAIQSSGVAERVVCRGALGCDTRATNGAGEGSCPSAFIASWSSSIWRHSEP